MPVVLVMVPALHLHPINRFRLIISSSATQFPLTHPQFLCLLQLLSSLQAGCGASKSARSVPVQRIVRIHSSLVVASAQLSLSLSLMLYVHSRSHCVVSQNLSLTLCLSLSFQYLHNEHGSLANTATVHLTFYSLRLCICRCGRAAGQHPTHNTMIGQMALRKDLFYEFYPFMTSYTPEFQPLLNLCVARSTARMTVEIVYAQLIRTVSCLYR